MDNTELPYGITAIPELSHWTGYLYLHIVKKMDGKLYVPDMINWVEQPDTIPFPDAQIRMTQGGQNLFDKLYALGYRPSDGKNNDLVIKAKDDHISDLRNIVFKTKSK